MHPLEGKELYKGLLKEYGLESAAYSDVELLRFHAGEKLYEECECISKLMFITNGVVKMSRASENGRTQIVSNFQRKGIIGEIELMTGEAEALTTVTAVSDVECLAVNYSYCRSQIHTNTILLYRLSSVLAERLKESSLNFTSSVLHSAKERLGAYILQGSYQGIFKDVLMDTAVSVGISYRHMFRILDQMCRDGILEKVEQGFKILKEDELRKLAGDAFVT